MANFTLQFTFSNPNPQGTTKTVADMLADLGVNFRNYIFNRIYMTHVPNTPAVQTLGVNLDDTIARRQPFGAGVDVLAFSDGASVLVFVTED